ncbi:hypothetical protein [Streptomyces sp. NPDC047000]|uniref:anti-sigma factor family protein n=1 Tax=Streptomyces sp. NPDC047000 TaxID=3155474 RepID=UPI0033F0733A
MTPTTDTTGHPDVTELSDLTEGLLPPSRTTEVRRHLDECALCADVHASLAEIQELLGTLPLPTRMPDDVAQRLDAALATEALVSRETSTGTDHPCDQPAGHSPDPADRTVERSADRPAGRASAATGPGRKERKPLGHRRKAVLGAVLTAALLGGGSLLVSTLVGHDTTHTSTTADTFTKDRLKTQVAELLARKQGTGRGSDTQKPWGIQSETDHPQTMIQPSVPIPGCVRAGTHRGTADVLAAKKGTYDGKEAYLVVLPAATDDTKVTVYVVDASCHEPTPGQVLLTESYDRP